MLQPGYFSPLINDSAWHQGLFCSKAFPGKKQENFLLTAMGLYFKSNQLHAAFQLKEMSADKSCEHLFFAQSPVLQPAFSPAAFHTLLTPSLKIAFGKTIQYIIYYAVPLVHAALETKRAWQQWEGETKPSFCCEKQKVKCVNAFLLMQVFTHYISQMHI